jgi:ferrous-iron efflux pump FieF
MGISREKNRLKRWSVAASISVAVILITIKLIAWYLTGSISLLSSLTDSLLDFGASLINMIAIYHAAQPADEEHRFGHGKIEALAALLQSVIVIGSSCFLIKESIERFFNPQPLQHALVGIWVMVTSIILLLGLVSFQRHVIRRTKSLTIIADSTHYKGDLLLNVGVLVSIGSYHLFGWSSIDAIFGAIISTYIIYMAYDISKSAVNILLDREIPAEDRAQILEIIESHAKVKRCTDLRTRSSGAGEFIYANVVFPATMSIQESSKVIKQIEESIVRIYPDSEILLHSTPHKKD